jgi:phage/plasmid-like protein (TIGR03299 family)
MSHEIYKEKFVSLRQPAWHGLGHVLEQPLSAVEAAKLIEVPQVEVEAVSGSVSGLLADYKAIVGVEKSDAGEMRTVYSIVSKDYHEITHDRFLETWDKATGATVETLGLLYDGSSLFLTTKLPSFGVKGDEIEAYLLALNPLKLGKAVTVRKTPVRVVCHNTLEASGRQFTSEWRVIHTQDAAIQLEGFLRNAFEQSRAEYETVKDLFEILASKNVDDATVKAVYARVYPGLEMPNEGRAADDAGLKLLAAWERSNGAQIKHREICYNLYSGDGLGSMSEAAKGTTWGVYNAVVEYEQYLKRYGQQASFLFGAGAQRVEKAYELSLEVANGLVLE